MAEHFLNSAQVSATFNKVCSERMPERVRADLLFQSDNRSEIADNRKHHHTTHPAAVSVKENPGLMTLLWRLMRRTAPHLLYIYTHKFCRFPAHGHKSLFIALPSNTKQARVRMKIIQLQRYQLRYPQARTIQHFKHSPIACAFRRRQVNSFKHSNDLVIVRSEERRVGNESRSRRAALRWKVE